jgi:4-hydroxythreonine-4-phosphate dehydrogenase
VPLPAVAITVGDPSGIGPEIAVKASRDARVTAVCRPVLYGPHTAEALQPFPRGQVSARSGQAAYDAIVSATRAALAGDVDAVATGPINKAAFAAAGLPWKGHTELFADLCGVSEVAMMFWSDRLRVVLATVHVPLAEVPRAFTTERLLAVIRLAAQHLPRFGLRAPRLAVAALNPHAGEHGLLGTEEETVIAPAIAIARSAGIDVAGPFPADTLFVRAARGEFDVVVAAYHDQALVPVKLVAFGTAVNVTIGLPIIRTSVDHGTAFDIAGEGTADPGSLVEAVMLAARLARSRDPGPQTRSAEP